MFRHFYSKLYGYVAHAYAVDIRPSLPLRPIRRPKDEAIIASSPAHLIRTTSVTFAHAPRVKYIHTVYVPLTHDFTYKLNIECRLGKSQEA